MRNRLPPQRSQTSLTECVLEISQTSFLVAQYQASCSLASPHQASNPLRLGEAKCRLFSPPRTFILGPNPRDVSAGLTSELWRKSAFKEKNRGWGPPILIMRFRDFRGDFNPRALPFIYGVSLDYQGGWVVGHKGSQIVGCFFSKGGVNLVTHVPEWSWGRGRSRGASETAGAGVPGAVMCRGGSCIVSPLGDVVAGPLWGKEPFSQVELTPSRLGGIGTREPFPHPRDPPPPSGWEGKTS